MTNELCQQLDQLQTLKRSRQSIDIKINATETNIISIIKNKSNKYNNTDVIDFCTGILMDNIEINALCLQKLIDTDENNDFELDFKIIADRQVIPQLIKFVECKNNTNICNQRKTYALDLLIGIFADLSPEITKMNANKTYKLISILIELISGNNIDHQDLSIHVLASMVWYSNDIRKHLINKKNFTSKLTELSKPSNLIQILAAVARLYSDILGSDTLPSEIFDSQSDIAQIIKNINTMIVFNSKDIIRHCLHCYLYLSRHGYTFKNPKQSLLKQQIISKTHQDDKLVFGAIRKWDTNVFAAIPKVIKIVIKMYFCAFLNQNFIKTIEFDPYFRCIQLLKHSNDEIRRKAVLVIYQTIITDHRKGLIQEMCNKGQLTVNLKYFIEHHSGNELWHAKCILSNIYMELRDNWLEENMIVEALEIDGYIKCLKQRLIVSTTIEIDIETEVLIADVNTLLKYDKKLMNELEEMSLNLEIIEANREIITQILSEIQ
eukprot:459509_1